MKSWMMIFVVGLSVVMNWVSCSHRPKKPSVLDDKATHVYNCDADREFITTYQYLRSRKEFAVLPKDMRQVALVVSKGCTGAAGRFIEITEVLIKSRLGGRAALETARDIATRGEGVAEAFATVFRAAYAREFLDLDANSALRVAKRLTIDFKGEYKVAAEDFRALARFCVERKGLDLPKKDCADLAGRIAAYSEENKLPVAQAFIEAVDFMREDRDINLAMNDAIKIAESLVAVSPEAPSRFKNVFEFASEKNGLGLTRDEAVKFAVTVAQNTKAPKPL